MLMRRNVATLAKMAEELLPQMDSIWVGSLSGKEAKKVILEGESVLRELLQLVECSKEPDLYQCRLIKSLRETIKEARKEIQRCEKK